MQQQDKPVGSVRTWEIVVAVLFLVFGAVVAWDSYRIGAQWASDGPQAGYFPFYIGVIICISSLINVYSAAMKANREPFVMWSQLRMVLTVLLPSLLYVAVIVNPWFSLGIYVASAIFIAVFMRVLGHYSWGKVVGVSLGVMIAFFVMFEIWFKVPLPKGPLEAAFGFA